MGVSAITHAFKITTKYRQQYASGSLSFEKKSATITAQHVALVPPRMPFELLAPEVLGPREASPLWLDVPCIGIPERSCADCDEAVPALREETCVPTRLHNRAPDRPCAPKTGGDEECQRPVFQMEI